MYSALGPYFCGAYHKVYVVKSTTCTQIEGNDHTM